MKISTEKNIFENFLVNNDSKQIKSNPHHIANVEVIEII